MGQQQLLLIVLGVIIVGIAIVVGINLFNANAVSSNRDAIISDLNNLGATAVQFYMKPTSMGGGQNTFTGWTIPAGLDSTANGVYTATVSAQSITITGISQSQKVKGNAVEADATVTPSGTTVTIKY
ncbi:MAG: hypothetical protein ACYC6P_10130 [Ignavibacteriaceae bacterium]